jgi:hypothetical protein
MKTEIFKNFWKFWNHEIFEILSIFEPLLIHFTLYKLGRGPSIWDDFAHTKGRITNDDNGDIACDSYHKYKDDIKLLKEMEPGTTISSFTDN